MRYLIDTNVWIDAVAGESAAGVALQQTTAAEWAGFSSITRLEIFSFPALTPQDEIAFERVLEQFNEMEVSSVVIDEAIRLRKTVRIKIPDALIAASAMVMQAAIVTRNTADFKMVQGLRVIQPADLRPAS